MLLRFSRILLVDDSTATRKIIRSMLAGLGLENVDEAGDGGEALSLIGRRRYDLVISDWIMEPMSGLELLRTLRSMPAYLELPFVMMTSQTQVKFMEVARDAGATHYIAKPFDAAAIAARLAALREKPVPQASGRKVVSRRRMTSRA